MQALIIVMEDIPSSYVGNYYLDKTLEKCDEVILIVQSFQRTEEITKKYFLHWENFGHSHFILTIVTEN